MRSEVELYVLLRNWLNDVSQIDRTFPSIERAPIEVLNAVFDAVFDEGQKSLDRFARVQFLLAVMSIFLPWRAAARDIPAL